jgi:hypothetical protein
MDGLLDPRSDLGVSSEDQSSNSALGRGISSGSAGVCHTCLPMIDALVSAWDAHPAFRAGARCVSCGGRATLLLRARQLDLVDIVLRD